MREDDILSEFEPIPLDNRGGFNFIPTLVKLRRNLAGLGNKVIPVYVMNNSPIRVYSTSQAGAGGPAVYDCPKGKKARILGATLSMSTPQAVGVRRSYLAVSSDQTDPFLYITGYGGIGATGGQSVSQTYPFSHSLEIKYGDHITMSGDADIFTSCSVVVCEYDE
jgi:hypothetical protein